MTEAPAGAKLPPVKIFVALVLSLGFGGLLAFGIYKGVQYLRKVFSGPADAVKGAYDAAANALSEGYESAAEAARRVSASAGALVESVQKQATQTERERTGDFRIGVSGGEAVAERRQRRIEAESAANAAADAAARAEAAQNLKGSGALAALQARIAGIKAAGADGEFVGDAYVPLAELEKQAAALAARSQS